MDRLLVVLHGEVVGWLQRSEGEPDPSFVYDPLHVAASRLSLSAGLPLRTARYESARVAPYLRGLLPENPNTLQRWSSQLGTDPDDTFSMLAHMGWDCPGAVQFCAERDLDALHDRRDERVPLDDASIAARLRRLKDHPADWALPEEHWSLGGQQEKFALTFFEGRWHEAHGSAATTHIFKPGIPHLRSQALIEHITMVAASSLGIDVAATQYLRFEDQWAVVVERFDRAATATGVQRLHQEDFCQALRRLPAQKYEARGGPTLKDMAGLIAAQSEDRADDALALADFIAINVVAGAPDGHSKNISMLRESGNWVAPLYDLATGLVYDKRDVDRSVAISVGGERHSSRIRRLQWERAAATLRMDADGLVSRVRQLAADFPTAFQTAIEACARVDGIDELAERSDAAIRDHCGRILDQLR